MESQEFKRDEIIAWRLPDGTLHREDGPAVINILTGTKQWFINGLRHRKDGPAVVYRSGAEIWYYHGNLHRLDGPASITCALPSIKTYDWFINNRCVTPIITKWAEDRNIDLNNLTDEDKAVIFVEWGNYGK